MLRKFTYKFVFAVEFGQNLPLDIVKGKSKSDWGTTNLKRVNEEVPLIVILILSNSYWQQNRQLHHFQIIP